MCLVEIANMKANVTPFFFRNIKYQGTGLLLLLHRRRHRFQTLSVEKATGYGVFLRSYSVTLGC